MKQGIHPDGYRLVVFEDLNNGFRFLTRSTAAAEETTKWDDGRDYPLIKVHITSASHPFFTGEERILDVEGRVDKFRKRAEAGLQAKDRRAAAAKKQSKRRDARAEADQDKSQNSVKPSK